MPERQRLGAVRSGVPLKRDLLPRQIDRLGGPRRQQTNHTKRVHVALSPRTAYQLTFLNGPLPKGVSVSALTLGYLLDD